jgi:hypothetical protein
VCSVVITMTSAAILRKIFRDVVSSTYSATERPFNDRISNTEHIGSYSVE